MLQRHCNGDAAHSRPNMAPSGGNWIISGNCFNCKVNVCEVQFCFPPFKALLLTEGWRSVKEKAQRPSASLCIAVLNSGSNAHLAKTSRTSRFPRHVFPLKCSEALNWRMSLQRDYFSTVILFSLWEAGDSNARTNRACRCSFVTCGYLNDPK